MAQKKVLGVLGGNYMSPAKAAAWIQSADLIVAADSGLHRVLEAGSVPNVVIGDFDSVSPDLIPDSIETVVDHGQDNTDCAKLLDYIKELGFLEVTLICAEGDLSDHFLDTLHNAVRSDLSVTIGLERGQAYILTGPFKGSFHVGERRRISMLPLETVINASMTGVQWGFSGKTIAVRGFTSISNMTVEPTVSVSFDEGSAYLFVESEEPKWQQRVE